ncbi:hypothetical protein GCM10009592_26370 [Brachybacterium rhamnosum]|uniref:DUF2382 domain-containing protein n=1 Tax=Brachybacterium rhamnosum TaxID=173361 RepID=A0ABW4Q1B0_9MICO
MTATTTPTERTGRVRADEVVVGEKLTVFPAVLFPALVLEATPGIDLNFRRVVEFRLEGERETVVLPVSKTVFVEPNTLH